MNLNSTSLKVLVAVGLVVWFGYAYHVRTKRNHEAAAYHAYRTMIGCHVADAIHSFGQLPPAMVRPGPHVLDRCYGRTDGYSDANDYYKDDQREFQRALKEAGW